MDGFLILGRVLRPHGLKGLLCIQSYAAGPASFLEAGTVFLGVRSGPLRPFFVDSVKPRGRGWVLALEGVTRREDAEALKGCEILAKREAFLLEEGEYFWEDLLGMQVVLEDGRAVGRVTEIVPTGANDVFVVEGGGHVVTVPAIESVVRTIDLQERRMVISPMEGMLDLDAV